MSSDRAVMSNGGTQCTCCDSQTRCAMFLAIQNMSFRNDHADSKCFPNATERGKKSVAGL